MTHRDRSMSAASPGPRIYNLFPTLLGPVSRWSAHLAHIAALQCNWIYLNPFHYPGFSGSLYAVKDYFAIHPALTENGYPPDRLLRRFLDDAHGQGPCHQTGLSTGHLGRRRGADGSGGLDDACFGQRALGVGGDYR